MEELGSDRQLNNVELNGRGKETRDVALTADQHERILQTIKERIGGEIKCPLCGRSTWMFTEGVAMISAQATLDSTAIPDQGLPALPLVCLQCGNTHFLNVLALGLGDLFAKSAG